MGFLGVSGALVQFRPANTGARSWRSSLITGKSGRWHPSNQPMTGPRRIVIYV